MGDRVPLHSITEALGVHAQHIDRLWHVMLWVCGFMYLLVLGFLAMALIRRGRRQEVQAPAVSQDKRLSLTLAGWTALIVLGLFGLTLFSYVTDRALVEAASKPQITLKITAHQWWWEIEYVDPDPSRQVRTANELHLPVNAPVQIQLAAHDVIHSFWVPSLHGKQDMIPGRSTDIRLQPTEIGTYRGLCAEFCGVQHSKMQLEVVVETPEAYASWYERQLQSPPAPTDPLAQRGYEVFMASACNMCHAIAGTDAYASVGPDLSHIAGRRTIAAGALPNDRRNLRAWLENPQRVKPGNHMPIVTLAPDQLDALSAYLGTLR
jgi:cytochrome c oxidase subunit II